MKITITLDEGDNLAKADELLDGIIAVKDNVMPDSVLETIVTWGGQ
jgi:hypothetical protein